MTTKDTGGSAFPRIDGLQEGHDGRTDVISTDGMALRDYFAAKAMQGYLASYAGINTVLPAASALAADAYHIADALLAARKEES